MHLQTVTGLFFKIKTVYPEILLYSFIKLNPKTDGRKFVFQRETVTTSNV